LGCWIDLKDNLIALLLVAPALGNRDERRIRLFPVTLTIIYT
jgi:hypothetical protein